MKFLLILSRFCVVYVTIIAVLENWRIWSLAENLNPVCNTTECQNLAHVYLRNMNFKGEPCTDFYDYVCHNWLIYNPKPNELDEEDIWSTEENLGIKALMNVRKLLENKNASGSSDVEKAKLLYKVCMDIPFLPKSNASAVTEYMRKIGKFPLLHSNNSVQPFRTSWSEIHQGYVKLTGESAFFDFNIMFVPGLRIDIMTELKTLESAYGALHPHPGWPRSNQLNHYKTFLNKVIRSLVRPDYPISKELMDKEIDDVLELRKQLTWCMMNQRVYGDVKRMRITQFQRWYSEVAMSQPTAQINWLEEIRAIYKTPDDPRSLKITEMSKLKIQLMYFKCLARLLGKTEENTIVNHIHLYFAEKHLEFNSEMLEHLKGSVTNYGPDVNGGIRSSPHRWKSCIDNDDIKSRLEKVYTNLFFQRKDKLKVQELFENAKKLLEKQISESTWLDKQTKINSIHKVRKMQSVIGYPDWFDTRTPPLPDLEPPNILDAEAQFDNDQNYVFVTSAYLQCPMYIPNMPYVIDYGATMNVFGHELHHAFDRDGIEYNSEGVNPFWSNSMKLEQAKHTKCFVEQFTKYKENVLVKQNIKPPHNMTFMNSVDEDMADVMGLKLSYMGFQEMLKKNRGYCPILPGFEQLGCEKLFFIAFANSFCSYIPPEQEETILYESTHSLPAMRINGAVANLKEFSAAFGCKADAPLNLNRPCDFWKQ